MADLVARVGQPALANGGQFVVQSREEFATRQFQQPIPILFIIQSGDAEADSCIVAGRWRAFPGCSNEAAGR